MDEQLKNQVKNEDEIEATHENDSKTDKKNNHVTDKRSRLISAALVATIILSFISVLVFGIFQITSKMLVVCPQDLPVNDPAPILWQDVVAEQTKSAKLGVPDKLNDVYLKGLTLAENKSK
ncbi:MAG: hypothetical protein PHS86_07180 [Syntrophaceae bacterium]|nr:hypothetical protein [Syntrophaceae bacterium]